MSYSKSASWMRTIVPGHVLQPRADRVALAARPVLVDHAHARPALVAAHDVARPVGAVALDDDDFFLDAQRLREHGVDDLRRVPDLVEHGQDDRQLLGAARRRAGLLPEHGDAVARADRQRDVAQRASRSSSAGPPARGRERARRRTRAVCVTGSAYCVFRTRPNRAMSVGEVARAEEAGLVIEERRPVAAHHARRQRVRVRVRDDEERRRRAAPR